MRGKEVYNTCHEAITTFGVRHQLLKLVEELSELQKEICKWLDDVENLEKISEEMADVEITMYQARMIFGNEDAIDRNIASKLKRLKKKIEERNEERKGETQDEC